MGSQPFHSTLEQHPMTTSHAKVQHHKARLARRLLRHHVPLAGLSLAIVAAVWVLLAHEGRISRLTVATAYAGLILLAGALLLGPLNILRARPNPISTDLRRDMGIWAAMLGFAHVAVGLLTHFPGEPWLFFFNGGRIPLRLDTFGIANYLGLAATLILMLLLALSNDWALRRFGTRRWKALQRSTYLLLGLVIIHALVYFGYEDRGIGFISVLALIAAAVVAMQLAGIWKRKQARTKSVDSRNEFAPPRRHDPPADSRANAVSGE
jgi:sulfoxide reductase heme-binding subunit YedZ